MSLPHQTYTKLSNDQRRGIVEEYLKGRKPSEVARLLQLKDSSVRSVISLFERTGRVEKVRGGGRVGSGEESFVGGFQWDEEVKDFVKSRVHQQQERPNVVGVDVDVEETPTGGEIGLIGLRDEIKVRFPERKAPSLSTLSRFLKKDVGIKIKLVRNLSTRSNDPEAISERMEWSTKLMAERVDWKDFIFVDESGFQLEFYHTHGNTSRSSLLHRMGQTTKREPHISLAIGIGREGLLASKVKLGRMDKESFNNFFVSLLSAIEDQHRVVMMDRDRIHHDAGFYLEHAGHSRHPQPRHSPWLNLAELALDRIKLEVRHDELSETDHLLVKIDRALSAITPEVCAELLVELGENIIDASMGNQLGIRQLGVEEVGMDLEEEGEEDEEDEEEEEEEESSEE